MEVFLEAGTYILQMSKAYAINCLLRIIAVAEEISGKLALTLN